MRRSNTQRIGDILKDFVRDKGFENQLAEVDVLEFWNTLMGPAMIRYTRNARVSKGILYVSVSSSVVRAELLMMREELRKKINDKAGREIIRQIVFA
jgi:predicted nucleic acid-binding Zn ribbon protein